LILPFFQPWFSQRAKSSSLINLLIKPFVIQIVFLFKGIWPLFLAEILSLVSCETICPNKVSALNLLDSSFVLLGLMVLPFLTFDLRLPSLILFFVISEY